MDERSARNLLKYLELESSPCIIDQLAEDPDFADANESIMELRNLLKYCKAFKVSYEVREYGYEGKCMCIHLSVYTYISKLFSMDEE